MTVTKSVLSGCLGALAGLTMLGLSGQAASAQTYGLATMQPGTLAHTVASAIAKTLKEKGGLNTLVQNTAGESVLIPMVAKGEIDLGMANMLEVVEGIETGKLQNDLRIIGSIYVLRMGFFTRKDSGIVNMADVKGKRVPAGYSAMRTLDKNTLAMLATADLTLNDVKPVMVPNVLRGGDDFMAGANDMFMFSFGGPKVREADATLLESRVLPALLALGSRGPAPVDRAPESNGTRRSAATGRCRDRGGRPAVRRRSHQRPAGPVDAAHRHPGLDPVPSQ